MKKKLYEGQKHTIYELQLKLKLGNKHLYNYCGNYEKIKRMPYQLLKELAKIECMELNELWQMMLDYAKENEE